MFERGKILFEGLVPLKLPYVLNTPLEIAGFAPSTQAVPWGVNKSLSISLYERETNHSL
jgi:hypothetical protein